MMMLEPSGDPRGIEYQLHTANLIAIYNTPNLYLSDADRIELEKTILKRAGLKDA